MKCGTGADLGACQPANRSVFIDAASSARSGRSRQLKSILGKIRLTELQAKALAVKAHTHLSPYLEKCCLLVSANASYERSAQELPVLTGLEVSRGTQQRLVQRQTFEMPVVEETVAELSLDGGKVRIRTPLGEGCRAQDLYCGQSSWTLPGSLSARECQVGRVGE